MIPFIAPLFSLSCSKLMATGTEPKIGIVAIDLIAAVIIAVPSFLNPAKLGEVLLATITIDVSGSGKHFDALIASVAKRVPTVNLLPVVCNLWSRVSGESDHVSHSECVWSPVAPVGLTNSPTHRLCKDTSVSYRGLSDTRARKLCLHLSRLSLVSSWVPLTYAMTQPIPMSRRV